jgi:hypothetical protein
MSRRLCDYAALVPLCWALFGSSAHAIDPVPAPPPLTNFGPFNVNILEGGVGLQRPLDTKASVFDAGAPWSMAGWLRISRRQSGEIIVSAIGEPAHGNWFGISLSDGTLSLIAGPASLHTSAVLESNRWYAVAAVYDGSLARLYLDGRELATAPAATPQIAPFLELAPESPVGAHFGGSLADWTLTPSTLGADRISAMARARPEFPLITFNTLGAGWPLQEHAWRGLLEPQDPWTLPHANSLPSAPIGQPLSAAAALTSRSSGTWTLGSWRLSPSLAVDAPGDRISLPDFDDSRWYQAIVPGTVLTTLIARGVYPDPDYGLNNLAIPDSLSRQDYWYRSAFELPLDVRDKALQLTFKGINYAAEVWVNGTRIGAIKGAFIRGIFDVTGLLRAGQRNVVAVKVSPPPHPGIPHEQSIAAGPGQNGGNLALDGPTFIASEGWDWIPGIRDRNTGIWQDVEISATGKLRLMDPHVVTHLPLPRTDSADVSITAEIDNRDAEPVRATLSAHFGDVTVRKTLMLAPGRSVVTLDRREFQQLHLISPRLWWPNGYGLPNLYHMRIALEADGAESDSREFNFGVRELSYELSLFDSGGRLRRVEVNPTQGSERGEILVDTRHQAINKTAHGWAQSLTPAGEKSPAVHPISSESLTPYLVIRVNGVAIAARGGSWGMDDSRKRVSRAHLEPYFQMHQDAHLNIIRNWLGQDTEDVFYELADEYGLLILNDFWESTQDFQLEAQDPNLFLANAKDVISRYRNHPSIAVWFGRNEGVPQPILNEGLDHLVNLLDGTRLYTGSSNSVNLQGSGPYNYRPPEQYFTTLAQGFSVEVGTPSLSTLESLQASIPAADRWPLSDTYAYHDWHFGGNGDVASFMAALAAQYGEAVSLEDFERKAQLLDYASYRAIFEGFQAHLWTRNSGRLLWMTHPSWPSNTWQIYSSDYDTAAAYYAVKKACEPLHAQLNLPDFTLAVANISRQAHVGLQLRTRILTLDGQQLQERIDRVNVDANSVVTLKALDLKPWLKLHGLVLVQLNLTDTQNSLLSNNLYWQSEGDSGQRRLTELVPQPIAISARSVPQDDGSRLDVLLKNLGREAALANKITVFDKAGKRVLPIYYQDNYITLLPGESRHIEVRCPASSGRCARVAIRGWNAQPQDVEIAGARE